MKLEANGEIKHKCLEYGIDNLLPINRNLNTPGRKIGILDSESVENWLLNVSKFSLPPSEKFVWAAVTV